MITMKEIYSKQIGLFLENGTSKYLKDENEVTISEFLLIYFEKGIVILRETNGKFKYLETSDIEKIKSIIMNADKIINSSIKKEEIKKQLDSFFKSNIASINVEYRREFIDYNETVDSFLNKLKQNKQIIIPVIKDKDIVGIVSKDILKSKIKQIYDIYL